MKTKNIKLLINHNPTSIPIILDDWFLYSTSIISYNKYIPLNSIIFESSDEVKIALTHF